LFNHFSPEESISRLPPFRKESFINAAGSIMKAGTTGAPPRIVMTATPGMVSALPVFSFIRKGFVDQHDRDIIFDLVDEATRLADQSISCPV